jgi:hypothetical protein
MAKDQVIKDQVIKDQVIRDQGSAIERSVNSDQEAGRAIQPIPLVALLITDC